MAAYSEMAFITATNDGKVLNADRSRTIETSCLTLTEDEINERRNWNNIRGNLQRTFAAMTPLLPMFTNIAEVLNHRVPPPTMGTESASQRTAASGQRNRYYFPQLSVWDDFGRRVEAFPVDQGLSFPRHPPLYSLLVNETVPMITEDDEMQYLVRVISYLQDLNVHLDHRTSTDAIGDMDRALSYIGDADATGVVQHHLIAPVEGKSTQNLLLAVGAAAIAAAYNDGYNTMTTYHRRNKTWCHVCRPLAQLFRQMKNNNIRFGVLTSATRTYFVGVCNTSPTDTTPRVCVSKSYLLGEKDYLRAWAYFADLATKAADGPFTCPENWGLASTPTRAVNEIDENHDNENHKDETLNGDSQDGNTSDSNYVPSEVESSHALRLASWLPFVSVVDLDIMDPIGYGRNGAVFRVRWKGQQYALKQSDTSTAIGLESFIRESQAYALLQDVWGVLVPKPMFLSELRDPTIKFLGLQLGRTPTDIECRSTSFATNSRKVLQKLYRKFGFEHLDAEVLRNWLYVWTGEIAKPERLVVTDLEDYRRVPTRTQRSKKRPRSAPKSLHRPKTVD